MLSLPLSLPLSLSMLMLLVSTFEAEFVRPVDDIRPRTVINDFRRVNASPFLPKSDFRRCFRVTISPFALFPAPGRSTRHTHPPLKVFFDVMSGLEMGAKEAVSNMSPDMASLIDSMR